VTAALLMLCLMLLCLTLENLNLLLGTAFQSRILCPSGITPSGSIHQEWNLWKLAKRFGWRLLGVRIVRN
jgi:hypothetical protein